MTDEEKKAAVKEFALKKGIFIAIFAGVMSACFNFGFESGKPIETAALAHGTNPLFQKNPSLIFILLGGFITNLVYCGYLNIKNKTLQGLFYCSGKCSSEQSVFYIPCRFAMVPPVSFFWNGFKQTTGRNGSFWLEHTDGA